MSPSGDPRIMGRAKRPLYTLKEGARLTGLPDGKVRRWSLGHRRTYHDQLRVDPPLIDSDGTGDVPLSFLNLLELRFLRNYRAQVSLPAIRKALAFAAAQLGSERPLLEHEFKVHGRELFLEFVAREAGSDGESLLLVNASRAGQISLDEEVWPANLERLFTGLDYQHNLAQRWWLADRSRPVFVDPGVHSGYPTTSKSRVRTDAISTRYLAGYAVDEIMADVDASADEIVAALVVEGVTLAA